jgi:peptide/nickel transport system permease protein
VRGRLLLKRLGWRVAAGAGVMWGAATIAFITLHVTSGDIALTTVSANGSDPTEAVLQQVRDQYGLNLPLWRQYMDYLWKLLHGNLGQSYQQHIPVTQAIGMQLVPTLELASAAAATSVVFAVVVAVVTAKRRRLLRTSTTGTELVLTSMPTFVVGLLLLIIFGLELDWLPISGDSGPSSLVLPVLTLALPVSAVLAQVLRSQLEEVLEQPFIMTARARGMREMAVRVKHALRHASIQLVTMSGYVIGSLLGGAVIVESLFNRQGLGQLMLASTTDKDIPLVTGVVLFAALAYVIVNILVDVAYTLIDPRVVTA